MAGLWQWVWWGAAIGLGVAGLGLLAWSLAWDRSRGRQRCPRCWYAMDGVPAQDGQRRCPECGRLARRERSLRGTRRRWRWAAAACVLLLAAAVCRVVPRAQREGWLRVVPTTVLLLAPVDVVGPVLDPLRVGGEQPHWPSWDWDVCGELKMRAETERMRDWQDRLLGWRVRRAATRLGHPAIPPGTPDMFERVCGLSVELADAKPSVRELLDDLERQTGMQWSWRDDPGLLDVCEFEVSPGRRSLVSLIEELESDGLPLTLCCSWDFQRDGIDIISSNDPLFYSDRWPIEVYDLSRVASLQWKENWNCFPGSSDGYWSNEQFMAAEDLMESLVCPAVWGTGGGSGIGMRFGSWFAVQAPASVQARISALLDAIEADGFAVCAYGEDGSRRRSGGSDAGDGPGVVVYDLGRILDADDVREDAIFSDWPRWTWTREDRCQYIDDALHAVICPSSWPSGGGSAGSSWAIGDKLVVRQGGEAHARIRALLEALRDGHGEGAFSRGPDQEELRWRVFNTTRVWRDAVLALGPSEEYGSQIPELEARMEDLVWDLLCPNGTEGLEVTPGSNQVPGRLMVWGEPETITAVARWVDGAVETRPARDAASGEND
jgi:hypothetical protein